MSVNPTGFGQALDVAAIVNQLMTVERRPIALLDRQQSQLQTQISAVGRLRASLGALQTAAQQLERPEVLRPQRLEAADRTLISASATGNAAPGSHSIEVLQLAQQQRLASGAFAAGSGPLGSGTLTIQFGSYDAAANTFTLNAARPAVMVSLAPGQGTLAGIRDAVNAAAGGVLASIVNDGTGERLILASRESGAASGMRIAVADADGNDTDTAGLSRLAWDPTAAAGAGRNLTESVAAQNASLRIDGVAVSRTSNTVGDALAGVTLNLLRAAPGAATTLTVGRDGSVLRERLEGFVRAYNDVARTIADLTGFNAASRRGGALQGDSLALGVQSQLRAVLGAAVGGPDADLSNLTQLGLTLQKDGTLALDGARLGRALEQNFDAIACLFTKNARCAAGVLDFVAAGPATREGTYTVQLTRLASRGTLTGALAAPLTVTAGVNDQLSLTVNGVAASVTLAAGSYTSAQALAAEIQTRANGAAAFVAAGVSVMVSESAGTLAIAAGRFGSGSTVSASGSAADALFGTGRVASAGVDVAGMIDGLAFTGSGTGFAGAAGNGAAGLRLDSHGAALGSYSVSYTIGYASRLDATIEALTASAGLFVTRTESLNARLRSLERRENDLKDRLADVEERHRAQFVALDAMLQRMSSTSSFLAAQLAGLPRP